MRPQTFAENQDSDQSISDEEDFNLDLQDKNCVPLGGHTEKEERIHLQSRLDILRGACELNCERTSGNLSHKRQTRVSFENEVEMPEFPDNGGFIFSPRKASSCNLDEEVISDNEDNNVLFKVTPGVKMSHKDENHNFASGKQDGESTWSAVSKETKALICLNENAFCSSSHSAYTKTNKSCKGNKNKSKPKFSFRFQLHKEGLSSPLISKNDNCLQSEIDEEHEKLKAIGREEYSIVNILEDYRGNKAKQPESVNTEVEDLHWSRKRTMAELLDGLQDNSSLLRRNSKKVAFFLDILPFFTCTALVTQFSHYLKQYASTTKKKVQAIEKSISPLGDRTIDSKDLPQFVDSRSSSEDEVDYQNQKLVPELKKQTIADRFQEALGATSTDEFMVVAVPRPSGVGLSGRLQQVMQNEKSIDMDFLKLQFMTKSNNESCSIDVQILSRYLDAKLTVCCCSVGRDTGDSQWSESFQTTVNRRERTIIFNARVCCDVDLEVGNLIRIHSPWKEVQVGGNDESIILSTYFSQI